MGFLDCIDFKAWKANLENMLIETFSCTPEEMQAYLQQCIEEEYGKLQYQAFHPSFVHGAPFMVPTGPTVEGSASYPIDDPARLIGEKSHDRTRTD